MGKVISNSVLQDVKGKVQRFVVKRYKDKRGAVVSQMPDMSRVKATPAQKANRLRWRITAAAYKKIKADPGLQTQLQAIADQRGINLSALVQSRDFPEILANLAPPTPPPTAVMARMGISTPHSSPNWLLRGLLDAVPHAEPPERNPFKSATAAEDR